MSSSVFNSFFVLLISFLVAFSQSQDNELNLGSQNPNETSVDNHKVEIVLESLPPLVSVNASGNISANSLAANESMLANVTVSTNVTLVRKFSCLLEETNGQVNSTFQMINGSTLVSILKQNPNITSRSQAAQCQIVLFYASWCPFSIQAAPHLNALPRGFPMLNFYAIDAHLHNSLSTMQGVMAIPSLFLFHNGKAAARYNETEYKVDLFGSFITRYTGIGAIGILNRTSADFMGPLPTTVLEATDPWLILSWIVLFISVIYWFTRSNFFWSLIENIRNTWREAEAQHEHAE